MPGSGNIGATALKSLLINFDFESESINGLTKNILNPVAIRKLLT